MRLEIDVDSDAMYVYLSDEQPRTQEELPSGVIVDLDDRGAVVGVEILRAAAGWDAEEILRRYAVTPVDADSLRYLATLPTTRWTTARQTIPTPAPSGVATSTSSSALRLDEHRLASAR
jgi:uncharacterized protein YuzE